MGLARPLGVVLLVAGIAADDFPGRTDSPASPRSAAHEAGRRIYNTRCYFCHGYSGDARTVAASALEPKPRDFASAAPSELDLVRIERAIAEGRPATAMTSFANVLSPEEVRRVAAFVHQEFVVRKAENTRYHTRENGWAEHERYQAAFPFAAGQIPIDTPEDGLSADQAAGKRLFMSACLTCHDRASPSSDEQAFALRSVSYPPYNYAREHDAAPDHAGVDRDDPYERHEAAPKLADAGARERRGERIFQFSCAYCHANDGTGRNWIGAFISPPPPDLTHPVVRARLTRERMVQAINDGVAGRSMPAWRSVLSSVEIEALVAYMERAFTRPGAP